MIVPGIFLNIGAQRLLLIILYIYNEDFKGG
jgi:hypothetical protein